MRISHDKKRDLGARIRQQRDARDISLRDLAKACDMNYATLYDIECGNGFPRRKVVRCLVERLFSKPEDKIAIYDLYAKIKESAPPDVIDYLYENHNTVAMVRRLMQEGKGNG